MKKLGQICIALVILLIFTVGLNNILEKKIEKYYNDSISVLYNNDVKNTGVILQREAIKRGNLMFYGSSELGAHIEQNPKSFFPNDKINKVVNPIGRGFVQELQHAINFRAVSQKLKNSRPVFFISMTWFMEDIGNKGVTSEHFLMNFSELQFLEAMDNKNLSKELKKNICSRVGKLVKRDKNYKDVSMYCKLYNSNNMLTKIGFYMLKPYFTVDKLVLKTKDNIQAYNLIKHTPRNILNMKNSKKINWKDEYIKAIAQGKEESKNNQFNMQDYCFEKFYKNYIPKIKRLVKQMDPLNSVEYDDLNVLLKTCKESKIKPLFIVIPVNGVWYDYLGLPKGKRYEFYNKVEKIINDAGFHTLDFRQKEYEKYFMIDGVHLGWKGWLNTNEAIANYFKKN